MNPGRSCLAGCAGASGGILVETIGRGSLDDQGLSGCEDPLRYDGQARLTIRCSLGRGDFGHRP